MNANSSLIFWEQEREVVIERSSNGLNVVKCKIIIKNVIKTKTEIYFEHRLNIIQRARQMLQRSLFSPSQCVFSFTKI